MSIIAQNNTSVIYDKILMCTIYHSPAFLKDEQEASYPKCGISIARKQDSLHKIFQEQKEYHKANKTKLQHLLDEVSSYICYNINTYILRTLHSATLKITRLKEKIIGPGGQRGGTQGRSVNAPLTL